MPNASLQKFVENARKKGWSDNKIQSTLLQTGWQLSDISAFFDDDLVPPPPPPPFQAVENHGTKMWDTFLHILMFISLYASTVAMLWIFHTLIDQWFPNSSTYIYSGQGDILRLPLAILLVSFPFFAFLFQKTTRESQKNPQLKHLATRKTLIYLTLIITFITMIISMIALVFNFLSGDITTRFVLKFFVTAGMASLIFIYYLSEVKS